MRLQKYIVDESFELFRKLKIGVSNEKYMEHINILKDIQEKYELKNDIINKIDMLNKDLTKTYKGKHVFTLTDNNINLDKIKINRKRIHEKIVMKCMELNDELCKMKTETERKIKEKNK